MSLQDPSAPPALRKRFVEVGRLAAQGPPACQPPRNGASRKARGATRSKKRGPEEIRDGPINGSNDPCDKHRYSLCLKCRPGGCPSILARKKGIFIEKAALPHDTDYVHTALAGTLTADLPADLYSSRTYTYINPYLYTAWTY